MARTLTPVDCPDCGETCRSSQGLTKHRGSKKCLARIAAIRNANFINNQPQNLQQQLQQQEQEQEEEEPSGNSSSSSSSSSPSSPSVSPPLEQRQQHPGSPDLSALGQQPRRRGVLESGIEMLLRAAQYIRSHSGTPEPPTGLSPGSWPRKLPPKKAYTFSARRDSELSEAAAAAAADEERNPPENVRQSPTNSDSSSSSEDSPLSSEEDISKSSGKEDDDDDDKGGSSAASTGKSHYSTDFEDFTDSSDNDGSGSDYDPNNDDGYESSASEPGYCKKCRCVVPLSDSYHSQLVERESFGRSYTICKQHKKQKLVKNLIGDDKYARFGAYFFGLLFVFGCTYFINLLVGSGMVY